nr:immunoglobulin light chain junction region [Macaca mulatta]
GMIWHNNVVLF